jgi:hypothetical protein
MKYLLLALLAACATAPVVPPPEPSKPYASWPNQEWAKAVEKAVIATGLDKAKLADEKLFCPNGLTTRNLVHLMAAIVHYESGFKPAKEYRESFKGSDGKNIISTGLFQISFSSTQQARYGCKWSKQTDLHDPIRNAQCGVQVVAALAKENGVMTNHSGTNYKGAARYFSVMRPSGKLAQIKARLKGFCE